MEITGFIVDILKKIGRSLTIGCNEPRINQKRDRYGNSYWQVYDFSTNKSYAFGSEQDVRAWIEEHYHNF